MCQNLCNLIQSNSGFDFAKVITKSVLRLMGLKGVDIVTVEEPFQLGRVLAKKPMFFVEGLHFYITNQ